MTQNRLRNLVLFFVQVAARALGGRVGKNPSQRFVLTGDSLLLTAPMTSWPHAHFQPSDTSSCIFQGLRGV